jgi:hypothetical protein
MPGLRRMAPHRSTNMEQLIVNVMMSALGVLALILALAPSTTVCGAFSFGKDPGLPISRIGRITLGAVALLLLTEGIRGFLK